MLALAPLKNVKRKVGYCDEDEEGNKEQEKIGDDILNTDGLKRMKLSNNTDHDTVMKELNNEIQKTHSFDSHDEENDRDHAAGYSGIPSQ